MTRILRISKRGNERNRPLFATPIKPNPINKRNLTQSFAKYFFPIGLTSIELQGVSLMLIILKFKILFQQISNLDYFYLWI